MSELVLSVEEGERAATVFVSGDLDLPAGDALEALVAPMLGRTERVEIVLRDVGFVDSSGLGALLAVAQHAEEAGGDLVLLDPSPAIVAALDRSHTAGMFTMQSGR
jgi:anti-sigma B factor antagonist